MTDKDRLAALEAANVTLDTENAQLRQALRAIRKGLTPEADGEFWSARRWLDRRKIFHGDLSGLRVLELVAKHALHGRDESSVLVSREDAEKAITNARMAGECFVGPNWGAAREYIAEARRLLGLPVEGQS